MRLPKDILTGTMTRPRLFLCETDKTKICMLEPIEMSGSFKFNAYSDLTFTIGRTYIDMITGETQVNPFYDKIEALRLVYLEGFGYFEIQDPEIVSDGIREVKNITAYSLEYSLSQKYLEEFYINTGENNSVEVMYSEKNGTPLIPVSLYNIGNKNLSLLNLALEKIYGWKIGHIDTSLRTMTRTFEISRASVYDFIVQDICGNFNCFAVFDTVENTINLYAEALITKHIGDGESTTFKVAPAYGQIGAVSVDGYRTTKYSYHVNANVGYLTFDEPPADGARIEITDGDQTDWTTDVYVTFQNLAQEVNISYSADDIKTVLTVKGAEDLDIREVNMGLPYIVDISYYYTVDWMGQELFDAYTKYIKKSGAYKDEYTENAEKILNLQNDISFAENRTSLGYGIDSSVSATTVGTYYVISGGSYPNYHFTEVSLPSDYNANTTYYKLNGVNVTEEKVHTLYSAVRKYFIDTHGEMEPEIQDIATRDKTWEELLEELTEQFEFVENEFNTLKAALTPNATVSKATSAVRTFLDLIWTEMGRTPLKTLFLTPYESIEKTNKEAGYNDKNSEHYWFYYPVTIMLGSLNEAIKERDETLDTLNADLEKRQTSNAEIADEISISNNFTPSQLVRLSSFFREDEYVDDNFVETSVDTIETLIKTKQELLECGKIELSKLCEPKLAFSMSMANIYALPEFEPIIDQFQLGKLINVAIRDDYIKRARLLAVDINFDDFSDFTCEFGELTSLRTQSSIHADLLASALSAGKTVASHLSYWNKGADMATSTDLKIQQGLLSAIGGLYTSDQSVTIDDNGILLRKVNENGAFDPHQAWLKNNTILLSDDSFKNARTGLGEFEIDGQTFYGILAEAMFAGYIEGSRIVGGTIDIGNGTFTVDEDGNVKMNAASISGYVTNNKLDTVEDNLSARITVAENGVETKVSKNAIISTINQSAESVTINANKISLAGKKINLTSDNIAIASTNFSVTKDGKITANSGTIGSWNIGNMENYTESIYSTYCSSSTPSSTNPEYAVFLRGKGEENTIAIGVKTRKSSTTSWNDADTPFYVRKDGYVKMTNAHITGTVIAQDGTIAGYNIGPGGSYNNAIYKRVQGDNVHYEVGMKASNGDTDLAFYVKKSTNSWDSSSNVFYVRNNGQLYAENAVVKGEIESSKGSIGGFEISDIYLRSDITKNGTRYQTFLQAADGTNTTTAFAVRTSTDDGSTWNYQTRINYDGSAVMKNANVTGTITATAGKIGGCSIEDGVLNVSAANITSGTIASARIPNLNADKITAGTLDVGRIPNISASKITSGTISTDRLDASVITTGNFSSKSLSTGNLSVTNGGNIGIWTVNSNNYLYAISGNYGVSLSATSVSHGQGGSATWVNIVKAGQNASDERLKTNIVEFDDKFDNIFHTLKPVKFEYSKDFLGKGTHFGYIAQDVVKSFENEGESIEDYSFIYQSEIEDDSDEQYYQLNKSDFIALNTWQIQKLKSRIEELENRLEALEGNDTK